MLWYRTNKYKAFIRIPNLMKKGSVIMWNTSACACFSNPVLTRTKSADTNCLSVSIFDTSVSMAADGSI
jgi:hypothetical protein